MFRLFRIQKWQASLRNYFSISKEETHNMDVWCTNVSWLTIKYEQVRIQCHTHCFCFLAFEATKRHVINCSEAPGMSRRTRKHAGRVAKLLAWALASAKNEIFWSRKSTSKIKKVKSRKKQSKNSLSWFVILSWAQAGYSYRNCEICGMSLPIGMSMAGHLEAHANDKIQSGYRL